jgi:hypothetical protein
VSAVVRFRANNDSLSGLPNKRATDRASDVAGRFGGEELRAPGLLRQADRALYAAKATARNRVVVAGVDPVEAGSTGEIGPDEGAVLHR